MPKFPNDDLKQARDSPLLRCQTINMFDDVLSNESLVVTREFHARKVLIQLFVRGAIIPLKVSLLFTDMNSNA